MLRWPINSTAQRAIPWLMTVAFILPASISASCSCSAAAKLDTCSCVDDSPSSIWLVGKQCCCCQASDFPQLLSFQLCCCQGHCPCRCNNECHRPANFVVNQRGLQIEFDLIEVRIESSSFVGLKSRVQSTFTSAFVEPASALQRCISLSRFLL